MTLPKIKGTGPALGAEDHDRNMLFLSGFASLAVMLTDTARGYGFYEPGQGIFVLKEGYRYRVAASGAADHHLTTGAGLKLYVEPGDDGVYNFGAFNPAANGSTDDYAKLMLALGAVAAGKAPNKVGPTIFFPKGVYRFNSTIELFLKVHLIGAGGEAQGTAFVFPAGVSGIVVNAFNTGGGTAVTEAEATSAGLSGAAGSTFDGILFAAGAVNGKPTARADVDGIWLRAPATIKDCGLTGWPGCGIRIEAWDPAEAPGSPHLWGDARGWHLENITANWCGKTPLRVRGTRASGGMCSICNFTESGFWGFDDHSSGTNFYFGNHSATNGVGSSAANVATIRRSGVVNYGGSRWKATCVLGAGGDPTAEHLQALVETVPGADDAVWRRMGAAGSSSWYPTWTAGQPVGHYFPSGSYKFSNPASGHVAIGNYAEDDDGGGHYYNGDNVFVAGGIQTNSHKGQTLTGSNGLVTLGPGSTFGDDDLTVTVAENSTTRRGLTVRRGGDVWNLFNLDGPGDNMLFGKEGEDAALRITGTTPLSTFGTSGAPELTRYRVHVPTLALGEDPRRQTRLAAAPTTGEWARGDIVWNLNPSAGGNAAWVCVTAGTPGTWKACLPITE